jgi:hypothetical protein
MSGVTKLPGDHTPHKSNNTINCVSEEQIFQDCILKKNGLYGCAAEMELYNTCRSKEINVSIREEQRRENAAFHERFKKLTQ